MESYLHEQSPDINQGVEKTILKIKALVIKELCLDMPVMRQKITFQLLLELSHKILEELALLDVKKLKLKIS